MTTKESQAAACHAFDILGHKPVRYFAKAFGGVMGGPCYTHTDMKKLVTRLNADQASSYIALNPTVTQVTTKSKSADVTHWSFILLDIDPLPNSESNPIFCLGHVLGKLVDHPTLSKLIPCVYLIDSGRGAQGWIKLDSMPLPTINDHFRAERATRWLFTQLSHFTTAGCEIDFSCSDLSRLARLPGTVHSETNRFANFVYPGQQVHNTFPCARLLELFDADKDEPPIQPPTTFAHAHISGLLPYMNTTAAGFLTEGSLKNHRHRSAYAAARALREFGKTQEEVLPLIIRGGQLCPVKLSPDECARIVTNAFSRPLYKDLS